MDFALMLALGLVSSLHCVTMCGPLIAVASAPVHPKASCGAVGFRTFSLWQLAYQTGRGITYVALGAALGLAGGKISSLFAARQVGGAVQIAVSAVFIGLAAFAVLRGKAISAPRGGTAFGRLLRHFVTSGRASGMLVLGLLTGFLPCGVLYAAFARALAADSAAQGGLLMLGFWLGSAPLLAAVGLASAGLLRSLGRYANVLIAVAMLLTGAWLGIKGVKNLTAETPEPDREHVGLVECHTTVLDCG
jgi:sulfite exporter TauE/SafE